MANPRLNSSISSEKETEVGVEGFEPSHHRVPETPVLPLNYTPKIVTKIIEDLLIQFYVDEGSSVALLVSPASNDLATCWLKASYSAN